MKFLSLIFIFLILLSCSKPKTVFICGDHVCVNKSEAKQYFEENLSIEVKIVEKKSDNEINLVELNLNKNNQNERKISITNKEKTNKKLKTLSKKEITKIKKVIKKNKNKKKIAKKLNKNKTKKKVFNKEGIKEKNIFNSNNVNKKQKDVVDICTIIKKCSIEEISKYLLKEGKKKNFPDITLKQ